KFHQWSDMSIRYWFEIERLKQLQVHWYRRDPLFSTKYEGDSHQMIVNGVGEVVGGKPWRLIAALQQHDVIHVVLLLDWAPDQVNVLNASGWTIWRTKADSVGLSSFETTDYLRLRKIPAACPSAVIAGVALCRLLLFRHLSQLFTRAKTWICLVATQQLSRIRVIDQLALRLFVWSPL